MPEQQVILSSHKSMLAGNPDTSFLKIIALVAMIFDHIGVVFYPNIVEFRIVGRIALPLYAWCLVVGSEYTHSAFRYAMRLLVLGLLSQPLYVMALSNSWMKLNILFLLFLGVLAIAGIRKKRYLSQFWAPALCCIVLLVLDIDYGWRGLAFILLLYAARKSKGGLAAAFLAYAAFWGTTSFSVTSVFGLELSFLSGNILAPILLLFFRLQAMIWISLPLILVPTRSNMRMPHWLGYGLYPLHLLALIIAGIISGVPFSLIITSLKVF